MQTMVSTASSALGQPLSAGTQAAEPDVLEVGDKAGPWIVERELGRGGMGAVYAVLHEDIGKRAALKVMHRKLVSGSSAERILLEARVVNAVGHPNIVDIFETGALSDGRPYIVMERLEGVPLSYRADEGKILPDQVIGILLQVCDALIAAHAANIVHRDLKLDNVFLIDNPDDPNTPRVKLLDWGIAKVISNDVRHTIEGQLVGTPQYLSPEQARGAAVSPQTDVYSLGVMAYELFLEQLPFEAETSAEIMAMHLRATPPPPSDMWPDIPLSLENLLLAMLAKDPETRPTMLTVAHSLEIIRMELEGRKCVRAEGSVQTPLPKTRRSSRIPAANPGAPGFAPTEPASWPQTTRRGLHVIVGALALAASATLFLLTRDTERANAAPTRAAAEQVTTTDAIATPTPAKRDVVPSIAPAAAPSEVVTESTPLTEEAPETAPQRETKTAKKRGKTTRKAPVTPRRVQPVDPDGTLDPYL